jgi:Arc/MetJ family transcription regulator
VRSGQSLHIEAAVRTNIDIDDVLLQTARKLSGQKTKKATVHEALRLLVKLRRQKAVDEAFGRYRWRGDLERSRAARRIA